MTCQVMATAFQRLRCARTFDLFDLLSILDTTKASIDSCSGSFYASLKLIVVDSVTAVVGPLLGGKQTDGKSQPQVGCPAALQFYHVLSNYSYALLHHFTFKISLTME